jgi:tripartite-type tricarboxylate transporter receptor subunit TctC
VGPANALCTWALLVLALVVAPAPAALAAWPDDQPIKIIVPQAAGGTNDTVARIISVELAKLLKQSVVVENRPGASGAIGMQAVAQSRPDGYTLALASDSTALLDVLRPSLSWKFKRDLRAVGMIGDQPISVAVSARSPYKSFGDIVKAARQSPDKIPFATSGVGTSQHVVGEWLAKLANIQLVHIPYKGGGQATSDLLGGQVPVAVLGLAPMLAQEKSGGVRIVAVTSPQRNAAVPDVPTLTELGYPQIALTQWSGLVVPGKTPAAVVARISEELVRVLAMPEVRKRLVDNGIDPRPMASAQFDKFLTDYIEQWERVVATLNLTLD